MFKGQLNIERVETIVAKGEIVHNEQRLIISFTWIVKYILIHYHINSYGNRHCRGFGTAQLLA